MRAQSPAMNKNLADPGSCGIRLGPELRRLAEMSAFRSQMCLSHWIKRAVEEKLKLENVQLPESDDCREMARLGESAPVESQKSNDFDSEYSKFMEVLNEV